MTGHQTADRNLNYDTEIYIKPIVRRFGINHRDPEPNLLQPTIKDQTV
jgi:hypothetical protein